jgi:ABC-2 type transport system permease protein
MTRLLSLIKKEFLAIRNDKKSLAVVIAPPLIQLLIFSFAVTMDIKHIDIAVLDRDGTQQSRELIREMRYSSHIRSISRVESYGEGRELIDRQKVLVLMVIPSQFGADLHHRAAKIQLILDGRRSNTAQIAEGYLSQMIRQYQERVTGASPVAIEPRNFYNPNLNNFWWILPNLFCGIMMIVAIILTALSVARERELGTFEQILVSPLSSFEIMMGKLIPALMISLGEASLILLIILYGFGVPFNGSVAILYVGIGIFLFSISGVGLFISALSKTQQQAILGAFVFMLPSYLLSGFATPVENMPLWLQPYTDIIPLKYFLQLAKGTFLKDITLAEAWDLMLPMLLIGVVTLGVSMKIFKSRMA